MSQPETFEVGARLPRRIDTVRGLRKRNAQAVHAARRQRVMELICSGMHQKGIAAELGIGQGDVSYCICKLMAEHNCKTHAQLGAVLAKKGLV